MKCGLEIHQRLSGHKLFCSCPSPAPDAVLADQPAPLHRQLSSAVSELGQTDAAASFEGTRERKFEYLAPRAHACLVEADEEPPHAIDAASLSTTLQLAHAIGASVVDEIQVMRKTVVDGSNTSGFQRTSLVAVGGMLPSPAGPISIQTICLEEESAGILPPMAGHPAYRIDRLGIPLVEIATDPVFTTPAAARAGAEAIGLALRMLPNVMRGLGTIRQDVNISIPGGARVEIKGAQSLDLFTLLIENEMARQQGLIDLSNELEKRAGAKKTNPPSSVSWFDATELFSKTECKIVSRALTTGGRVLAAKLPHHGGLLGRTFYPGRRYGSELSDYAKAAGGVSGLIHSDEDLAAYRFSADELEELISALSCAPDDAFILIADKSEKAEAGMSAALARAALAYRPAGAPASWSPVPSETRKALDDGGSAFMRPLSGAHRMYPETDLSPIRIHSAMLSSAAKPLETAQDRRVRLTALLGKELGEQMLNSHQYALFTALTSHPYVDARLAASTLEQTLTTLRREGVRVEHLGEPQLAPVFKLHHDGLITKAVIADLLRELAHAPSEKAEAIVLSRGWARKTGDELLALWKKEGGDIKSFMSKYRLVVDGADLAGLQKK